MRRWKSPGRPRAKWTDQLRRDNNNVPNATLWRQAIGRGQVTRERRYGPSRLRVKPLTTTTTTMEVRIERFRPHAIDIFVFVCIYVLCFCAATDFSVNKDLYNSEILCVPKNVHLFIF